eukprot:TRINITY_DN11963_c0_g1_i2.p1 TRINITY_DN11963_c0_g1~~TRINITY_DN11963_c0_g1_i2.p1  ORF type:complete len:285 (+),score=17.49 TRINITY_DN11963_c0_g1_i2:795-1649(+)
MDKERAQKVQTILVESRIQKSDKPMIDGIKLELKNPDFAHQIRLNPNFDFINEVNEKTGVIEDCKTAKYKNITIRVFNSGLVLITGSLHKFKNNGVHNYDDFNFNEVIVMIDEMQKLFEFDLNKVKIDNLEFGVNITPPIPTKEVLKHLVCHKREPFKQITYPNSDYRECKHQQFIIKIYDKAKQYNQTEQILRVEVKCFKMGELNRIGIYYLSDLLNIDVYPVLGQMLTETWDEILYIDHTVNTNTHVLCVDTVSYTHLTLPTICSVQISVVAVSLKKKKKQQ